MLDALSEMREWRRYRRYAHRRVFQPPKVAFPAIEVVVLQRGNPNVKLVFNNPLRVLVDGLEARAKLDLFMPTKEFRDSMKYVYLYLFVS